MTMTTTNTTSNLKGTKTMTNQADYITEANQRWAEFVRDTSKPAVGGCIWIDGARGSCCIGLRQGDTFSDSGFPGCEFRSDHGTAINVKVTGRTFQRLHDCKVVRIQIEFVGDCEPSTFEGGWMKVAEC